MKLTIRQEQERDYRAVEEMTREAFWNLYVPGCDEHYLAHHLRSHPDFIKEMSLVALDGERIVGLIMFIRSRVKDESGCYYDTLTFGPLCVHPEYQFKGVGSALFEQSKETAISNNEKAVIILGHPRNYCRHGFKNCSDFKVKDEAGSYPFGQLVLELEKDFFKGHEWTFHLSPAYNVDPSGLEKYDSTFPEKEKKWQPSQEEFSIAVRAKLN